MNHTGMRRRLVTFGVLLGTLMGFISVASAQVSRTEPIRTDPIVLAANAGPSLVESQPPNNGIVRENLTQLVLRFDTTLTEAAIDITVGGTPLAIPTPTVAGKTITIALPQGVPTGDYQIAYSVKTAQNKTSKGAYTFSYTTDPNQTGAPTATTAAPGAQPITPTGPVATKPSPTESKAATAVTDQGGINSMVWIIAGVLVLGGALLVTVQVQKRQQQATQSRDGGPHSDHL